MPLPTGTVTFLFTDLEGQTPLWEERPELMRAALARHDALLRQAVGAQGGQVVKMTGDGLHAAFARAPDALAAALAAQRALLAEAWELARPLRARLGLHSGAAEERDGDYYGPAVNRAARVMQAAHGGQVLLSQVSAGLLRGALPTGVSLRDLGEHRLKDLQEPERLFQLVARDLPDRFPRPRARGGRPNNLPPQLTSFVGREREIAEVTALVRRSRLVTLTGAGGIGKTRLALRVGAALLSNYADGVFLVDLAPLLDPALVDETTLTATGGRVEPPETAHEALMRQLRSRRTLVVLDNCEHLVDHAARLVEEAVRTCPSVHLLATSRELLGVPG